MLITWYHIKVQNYLKNVFKKKRWKNMVKNVSHRKRKCIKLQILTTLTFNLEKIMVTTKYHTLRFIHKK